MVHFLYRRIFATFLTLFVIVTVTFFLMKAVPGDPFTQEKAMPEEILRAMYAHYKLDQPWYLQYISYLKSIVTWDLGPSFKYHGRTVNQIIDQGFPVSAELGLEALALALIAGLALGILAAYRAGRPIDRCVMFLAIMGLSVPSFILAACLQYVLAMKLHLLPVARWGTFAQTIMPAISLAALPAAFIARMVRTQLTEVLQQDYIKLAKAKGLLPIPILLGHALRNASLPVITYLGPLTANILTGSFVVEQVFGIPGLGHWFVTSITNRDYTVIMGITVFYSIILLLAVLITEIVASWVDPRIQLTCGG
jgi:oligopeptide transport system permease protein